MIFICHGTAVGSPVAPNYENLFLGNFRFDLIHNLKYYWQYMDDLFFIRGGEVDTHERIHVYLNSKIEAKSHYITVQRT